MTHVLTAIGDLDEATTAALAIFGTPTWLAPGRALDIPVTTADAAALLADARARLADRPIDLAVQPTANRRKRLFLADMDATMTRNESLDDLADVAGIGAEIAAITVRAMRGEIEFKAALAERVALLAGLPESALAEAYARVNLTPGGATLVRTMKAHGAYAALVSGGFRYFTSRVAAACGFDEERANQLEIINGKLTGHVLDPILDRNAKREALEELAAKHGIGLEQTLAVGDGANDVDMVVAAGLGVAFHGKPALAERAAARIEHNDLTALLYLQGYRRDEFVG